jgi:mono/diheme cytochrome c family protein
MEAGDALAEGCMPSRLGWFVLGCLTAMAVIVTDAYLFVKNGGVSMETTARPLPFEKTLARMALRASLGRARNQRNPLPLSEDNLMSGAREYGEHCAVCHGAPGQPRTAISKGIFPDPPQLFEHDEMVTDDPEGVTYWKVTHGIRLSGMPGFGSTLSDTQRWQVTMLIAHADTVSPAVKAAIGH